MINIPYPGLNKAQTKKVDKCVGSDDWIGKINPRTNKEYTKEEKIAICISKATKSTIIKVGERYYQVEKKKDSTSALEIITDCDKIGDTVAESKRLTTEERKALPDKAFCLVYTEKTKRGTTVKRRRFPAHDAAHVRNGLARLPQAKNLTPAQRKKVRNCLVKRAKKFKIEVSESFTPDIYTSRGKMPNEVGAFISNEDGTYTVMAGMEGQKGFNPWTGEVFTISSEFFEARHDDFVGKFYYTGHENKYNVEKRVAKITESFLENVMVKVDKKDVERSAMFHKIKPRNWDAKFDLEEGYLDDVSIDILRAIVSDDDEYLIVDGDPHGVAFVGAFGEGKGCPVCKVVHPLSQSCLVGDTESDEDEDDCDCPTGTPSVSLVNDKEANILTDKKKDDVEATAPPASQKGGVSKDELEAMLAKQTEMKAQIEELEFGNEVQALVEKSKMKKGDLMAIVSNETTPQERLTQLQALLELHEEEKKKIMESKIVTDSSKVQGDGKGDGYDFQALSAKLKGEAVKKKDGDA